MDLKDIKAIIDLMKKNSIAEFELERQDFKIKLKRGGIGGGAPGPQYDDLPTITYAPATGNAGAALPAPVVAATSTDVDIKSPDDWDLLSRPFARSR